MAWASDEFFKNKVILAPMVRMNTLPFRLLALDYGADIVYSEEIIDHKLLRSERIFNSILNTVDYIDKTDGSLIFRTCPREKDKLVFQIGTSNPERAAEAAALIEKDVAGIDINMGCPKHFSISGGMGAALLQNVSNARKIIKRVRDTVSIPVTCKIRIQEDIFKTIDFCKTMQACGACAIAIHGRTVNERPQHPNRNFVIREIVRNVTLPVIANGGSSGIETYEDILKFKEDTNCSSIMLARAAQYNVSIFQKHGKLPLDDVINSYLKYAIDYDNCFLNTKYAIQSMLRDLRETSRGKLFLKTQNLEQLCELWNLGHYCREKASDLKSKGLFVQHEVRTDTQRKKFKPDPNGAFSLHCVFIRSNFLKDTDLPKTVLLRHSQKCRIKAPQYETKNVDKLFQSIVTFDGKKYSSSYWEKSKKWAEQGAAIVCLCFLKVYDENEFRFKGVIV